MPSPPINIKNITDPCLIFDIGSKAIRLLIGSQSNRHKWSKKDFINRSELTDLAFEVKQTPLLSTQSPALQKIIDFIKKHQTWANPSHTYAFATAAFRWLQNKDEIIEHIYQQTHIRIMVLSEEQEAHCALLGVAHTHRMRKKYHIADGDLLLLIDQGGGSTEVSFIDPHNHTHFGLYSFDDLGALALQDRFFRHTPHGPLQTEPHPIPVTQQIEHTIAYVYQQLNLWDGYPQLNKTNLHVYGLGSAVRSLLQGDSFSIHNTALTRDQINHAIRSAYLQLHQTYTHTEQLFFDTQTLPQDVKNNLLLRSCGLAVYTAVMKKFSSTTLYVSGYGLRYGIYVALNTPNSHILPLKPKL